MALTALPYDGNAETRIMTCFNTNLPGLPRGCGTHITPVDSAIARQISLVANRINSYASLGYPEVVAGDFNVTPTDSRIRSTIYAQNSNGYYNEEDQPASGGDGTYDEPTFDRALLPDYKLDYIFVDIFRFVRFGADATYSSYSDHDPLRGTNTQRY